MDVEFAFLAAGAEASGFQKLDVRGMAISTIGAPAFPLLAEGLVCVFKLTLFPAECNRPHRLEVAFHDTKGHDVLERYRDTFRVPRPSAVQIPPGLSVPPSSWLGAIHLPPVPFFTAGDYGVHIMVDGRRLKVVPVYVRSMADLETLQRSTMPPAA
jgi:hypothetical protein